MGNHSLTIDDLISAVGRKKGGRKGFKMWKFKM